MEDTLRYFFSVIFQGFAAIITLGAMYFLFFFEKNENQKKIILYELEKYKDVVPGQTEFIILNGIVEYIKQKVLPIKKGAAYDTLRELMKKYNLLLETESKIKNYLPSLLKGTISILILSFISLFLVGYYNYLNYFLFIIGIIVIFLSIKYLLRIKKIIIDIIFSK